RARPLTIDDLEPIKVLGAGAFGVVYLAKDRVTGKKLAVKVMKEVLMDEQVAMRKLEGEKGFLQMHASWHDSKHFYIASEYCQHGDLMSEMDRWGKMPEPYVKFIAAELIVTLEKLHSLGMVHRDLKPDNVLFDDAGHVLLSDFGLVKIFDKESATTSPAYDADLDKCPPGMTKTACGTLDYMSPEMLFQKPYSHSVDYWALGVLMYFLLTGRVRSLQCCNCSHDR
ncbi:kinase-like protein, partial [Auriscalpium vulgare]